MCAMRSAVQLAEGLGAGVGGGEVLFRSVSGRRSPRNNSVSMIQRPQACGLPAVRSIVHPPRLRIRSYARDRKVLLVDLENAEAAGVFAEIGAASPAGIRRN